MHLFVAKSSITLVVVTTILHHVARAQKECFEVLSCVECLSLSQCAAWTDATGGRCLESCGGNAEVDCYSSNFFPNLNDEEICQLADSAVADAELCANQTNCGDCIGTSLSDDGNCQWFQEKTECSSVCDRDLGCGEQTTCPQVNCSTDFTTCVECLETPECAGWAPVAGCLESCNVIADARCYSTNTFPDKSIDETCQSAAENEADAQLCSSKTNCGECVLSTISDGNTTCQWFDDGEYCASGCGMNGCGVTTCQEAGGADVECDADLSCTDCLAASCAWAPAVGCLSSCDAIADTACFNSGDSDATDVCSSSSSENTTSSAETVHAFSVLVLALIGSVVAY